MIKEKWVVRDGSVYTEKYYKTKTDRDIVYMAQKSIAFNVGEKIAEHIVKLHNAALQE